MKTRTGAINAGIRTPATWLGTLAAESRDLMPEITTPRIPSPQARTSVLNLLRDLKIESRAFVRQELKLVQTELVENVKRMGRDATLLGIGGVVAYTGSIVLLIGLGFLVAWAISLAGVQPLLASFLGLLAVGLGVVTVGGVLVLKGAKTLSKESLKPQRTLQTLHELKNGRSAVERPHLPYPARGSAEMQARVEATQSRMGETLEELGRRFNPQRINAQVKQRIAENPYQAGLIALGSGVIGGLYLRRRGRRASRKEL